MTAEEVHRALPDDLERPETYPAPNPASVTRGTTHLSWVFLTDREAWKLKRPVRGALILGSGRGVILDATFREPALRARLRRRAARPSVSDAGESLLEPMRAGGPPAAAVLGHLSA
jgi:hypothetical protein